MNILIPMAGLGHRFAATGKFNVPKPLIDVQGMPMIGRVIENIGLDGHYIFIIRQEHSSMLTPVLKSFCECTILELDHITEGAACTCLYAKEHVNNNDHLVIANCDQIMVWDREYFEAAIAVTDVDGYIFTFTSDSPKNSYAKVNRHGYVTRVAEKQVISNIATTGVYHWAKGKYMVDACEKMIDKGLRYNNEYYLCPCYNEMIDDGLIVKTIPTTQHYPIGTPEDLETYLHDHQQNV